MLLPAECLSLVDIRKFDFVFVKKEKTSGEAAQTGYVCELEEDGYAVLLVRNIR